MTEGILGEIFNETYPESLNESWNKPRNFGWIIRGILEKIPRGSLKEIDEGISGENASRVLEESLIQSRK